MLKFLLKTLLVVVVLGIFPLGANAASEDTFKVEYILGEVQDITEKETITNDSGEKFIVQEITVKLLDAKENGVKVTFEHYKNSIKDRGLVIEKGEKIYVQRSIDTSGETETTYSYHEKYRFPIIVIVLILFVVFVIIFAGLKGLSATAGLLFSVLILFGFVVPQILQGHNPLLISFVGILLIGFVSFFLAHGFNKKTAVALVSTILVLAIAAAVTMILTALAQFTGIESEETIFLKNEAGNIDLRGLLLSGILFGVLGVLDDVTISQVSTVTEIKKANRKLDAAELYKRGINVGKDHVVSLVNTLVLAYVASSLPLLLFFSMNSDVPLPVILNEEFVATEIFRSVIGSAAIILAVPISTVLAAYALNRWSDMSDNASEHTHTH